jgi:hypothetical protein
MKLRNKDCKFYLLGIFFTHSNGNKIYIKELYL